MKIQLNLKEVIAPYKGELELWYSKNISLINYVLLIILTIIVIFFPKGNSLVFLIFKDLPKPKYKLRNHLSGI